MKIVEQSVEFLTPINGEEILKFIELCARTCYKSEDLITSDSAKKLITTLIKNDHTAMLEHHNLSVKVTCDRGVSHEIVRHRLASYAQESTRYVNYSKDKFGKEITVIKPSFFTDYCSKEQCAYESCSNCCLPPKELAKEAMNFVKI